MVADSRTGLITDMEAYYTFMPRKDNKEKWDEQTAFYNSKCTGVAWMLGGNGCTPAHYQIYDPVNKEGRPIGSIRGRHWVLARNPHTGILEIAMADEPYLKGKASILRIEFTTGEPLYCTKEHRVLDSCGVWVKAGDLEAGNFVHSTCIDDLEFACERTRYHIHASPEQIQRRYDLSSDHDAAFLSSHPASIPVPCGARYIESITEEPEQDFYDFGVPGYGNYYAGGLIHANSGTTTTSLAKACRFLLETPAPRRNTPFWIIAESYEQVCSMWDEKLSQQGHLPSHVIDYDRIHWFKRNNNWPFRVPLKSHQGVGGKNWLIEFKSWRQGYGAMMARSIGGFLFIEQFPWNVFQEVLRGCREYNFPGAKLVEYTPVNPDLSIEIEEMLQNGNDPGPGLRQKGAIYLPANWEVYHANTECAALAGHVDKEWFEEYFGMIPEDMKDVRMKGIFASFEGTIYKEFDTHIHCVGDEVWPALTNAHWIRGIDWGGGPENAFVALFVAFDTQGVAYVMDEYYSLDQSCTTIDHLCNIQEMMPWPKEDKRFGMTYADPADPDNFRIAAKLSTYAKQHKGMTINNMPMGRAKNAVYEGIEHIRMLLKCSRKVTKVNPNTGELTQEMAPRLYIHRANCPNLVREMKTYRWLRSGEQGRGVLNPRNARRAPSKYNDHACVTADTLVMMADGTEKLVTDVQAGDMVVTHRGIGRVLTGGTQTGVKPVLELRDIGGRLRLRCTADHQCFTPRNNWEDAYTAEFVRVFDTVAQASLSYKASDGDPYVERSKPARVRTKSMYVSRTWHQNQQSVPVYCIATEHGSCVFNGILTSQCDALRYALFTYHGMVGATIDSVKRLNRDVVHERDDMPYATPNSGLSAAATQHRL